MKKNLTELVFILDRSGSMSGLEQDTIGGFNAMIEKQKKEPGEAYVSTILFDNVSEVLHDRVKLPEVPKMTDRDYTVRGCTALIDAIGGRFTTSRTSTNMHAPRTCRRRPCSSSPPTAWRMPPAAIPATRSKR